MKSKLLNMVIFFTVIHLNLSCTYDTIPYDIQIFNNTTYHLTNIEINWSATAKPPINIELKPGDTSETLTLTYYNGDDYSVGDIRITIIGYTNSVTTIVDNGVYHDIDRLLLHTDQINQVSITEKTENTSYEIFNVDLL